MWAMSSLWWMSSRKCYPPLQVIVLFVLILVFLGCDYLNPKRQNQKSMLTRANMSFSRLYGQRDRQLSKLTYPQPNVLKATRKDVLVLTTWLAPIVWEGTFNIDILNEQFRLQNATIGLTVFAVQKYIGYLKVFLESAEMYFMVGHRVNYYIFTDLPDFVPQIFLHEGRQMITLKIQSHERWEDISMYRMRTLSKYSQQRLLREVNYLVCSDVDAEFKSHVGVEILSSLFGTLHVAFYQSSRNSFSYERRPQSQAYIPEDEGDFYYTGAFFGGFVAEVCRLTKACHQGIMIDKAKHIEALRYDESHLNKYLLYHKPTKVLSAEYMFSKEMALRRLKNQENMFIFINPIRLFMLPQKSHVFMEQLKTILRELRDGMMITQALSSS